MSPLSLCVSSRSPAFSARKLLCWIRFWRISIPGGVVFDEAHFGKFTAHYMRGSYVFDIHPPLGKMTFAGLGWLLGYDYVPCNYQNIGTVYDPVKCKYYILRGVSATFGSAVRHVRRNGASFFDARPSSRVLASAVAVDHVAWSRF